MEVSRSVQAPTALQSVSIEQDVVSAVHPDYTTGKKNDFRLRRELQLDSSAFVAVTWSL